MLCKLFSGPGKLCELDGDWGKLWPDLRSVALSFRRTIVPCYITQHNIFMSILNVPGLTCSHFRPLVCIRCKPGFIQSFEIYINSS